MNKLRTRLLIVTISVAISCFGLPKQNVYAKDKPNFISYSGVSNVISTLFQEHNTAEIIKQQTGIMKLEKKLSVISIEKPEPEIEEPEEHVPVERDEVITQDIVRDELITMQVETTAYEGSEVSCGAYADGYTATMTVATPGRTIAVDPNVIPLGTHVWIDGHEYVAEDTGGAIKGNKIDIYFSSYDECIQYGVRTAELSYYVTRTIRQSIQNHYVDEQLTSSEVIAEEYI